LNDGGVLPGTLLAGRGRDRPGTVISSTRITIARDQYKFSCAHMTVFPDGSKERLHGHNYTVAIALELSDVSFAKIIPFAEIRAALAELCSSWKERVLLAAANPHYRLISHDATELEFTLCGKRYVLPAEDVLLLPIDNIAVEPLAGHCAEVLGEKLAEVLALPHVTALEVTISESPGQGATALMRL
jgi:6-pyruvoyltetrahydropterin/6-carboxytetrahydropterin synthase